MIIKFILKNIVKDGGNPSVVESESETDFSIVGYTFLLL
jgi:hypothetical protein